MTHVSQPLMYLLNKIWREILQRLRNIYYNGITVYKLFSEILKSKNLRKVVSFKILSSSLFIIIFALFLSCSIHPDPRYTTSRSVVKRKENKPVLRKQTTKEDKEPFDNNSRFSPESQEDMRTRFALEVQRFMGAPYLWGGASPAGTDCSGLVRTVFRRALGLKLPHSTDSLYECGSPVPEADLRLGDLVFFRDPPGSQVSHVGIYLDQGQFVHASLSDGVTISDLFGSWYWKNYVGARRILDDSVFE